MTGSLTSKHGKYFVVVRVPDGAGGTKTKWINTGIPTEGNNKRKAQQRRMHTPDQQLHLHGILAPPGRKGAPLHESKERDLYNWRSTGNCDYINWRSHHAKLSGDLETG